MSHVLTEAQVYAKLRNAHKRYGVPRVSDRKARILVPISTRESARQPKANNAGLNTNGTVDHGLFQINDVWRNDPDIQKLGWENRYNGSVNAAMAAIVLHKQGLRAWATYSGDDDKWIGNAAHGWQGRSPAPARSGTYGLKAGKSSRTNVDIEGALLDALLSHHHGSLLQAAVSGVDSGAYTTTTPGTKSALVKLRGAGKAPAHDVARLGTAPPPRELRHLKGTTTFEGHTVAAWIAPVLQYARKNGWTGSVASGYRSYGEQKRIYDSGVRPAAVPGTSNHEGSRFPRGAVDVNGAQQLSAILLKSRYRHLLQYAGAKDDVHFSHPHNGSY